MRVGERLSGNECKTTNQQNTFPQRLMNQRVECTLLPSKHLYILCGTGRTLSHTPATTLYLSHTRTRAHAHTGTHTRALSHARTPEDDENIWRESAFNSDWRNALYLASFVVNKIGSSKYNLHILFLTRTIDGQWWWLSW